MPGEGEETYSVTAGRPKYKERCAVERIAVERIDKPIPGVNYQAPRT